MKYFSGFCLKNESEIFSHLIKTSSLKNEYTICGFSYGAINALKYTLDAKERIDKIIMLSPAFFNDKDEKFKKLQLITYKQQKDFYIDSFFKNIALPYKFDFKKYINTEDYCFDDLKELLYFQWKEEDFLKLKNKNILIDIYLGSDDNIINTKEAKKFFMPFCDIYEIKNASHILQQ